MLNKRSKRINTNLFFDSFKHFKNNFCNLICVELPNLVDMKDVNAYLSLKPVNYKSKYPDMKKIGLINYDTPSDNYFSLTAEGKSIYNIIAKKKNIFEYNISEDKRLDSIKPTFLFDNLTEDEKETITSQMIKLLISYYDSADCIRPYLVLIKIIEEEKIKVLDSNTMCNILAQTKYNALEKNIDRTSYHELDNKLQDELKRPLSYIYNALQTAGIIDEDNRICYNSTYVNHVILQLNEIYIENEKNVEKRTGRPQSEQDKFRDEVLKAYDYKCAITGRSIAVKDRFDYSYMLEAAHLIPYRDGGSFSVNNGIALSFEVHKLFDRGLFAFEYADDGNLYIKVSNSERIIDKTGFLKSINNMKVNIPNDDKRPDRDAIDYERKKYLLVD